jgi:Tetratricopeptide repeat.
MKIISILFLTIICTSVGWTQNMEEDNLVLYIKANVLYESSRYDEAIRMYNRILKSDPDYTNALLMRAKTKYALGAFRGTKMDMMSYIEKIGVTKDVIKIMALTELQLNNNQAATSYVTTALELDPYDPRMHDLAGDIASNRGERSEACEHYASAARLGNQRAIKKMSSDCLGYTPSPKEELPPAPPNTDRSSEENEEEDIMVESSESDETDDGGIVTLDEIVRDAERAHEEESASNDSSSSTRNNRRSNSQRTQNIEIDSKLSLSISGELGNRDVTSKPSIFLFSDQEGRVVIDLCVDRRGRVIEAVFNRERSTIFRSSLTSLALRKAKDFIFDVSGQSQECGIMTYHIKS